MRYTTHRYFFLAIVGVAAVTLVGWWSWNTVIELFNGPRAEFRHVVAVLAIFASLRALLLPGRGHRLRHTKLEQSS